MNHRAQRNGVELNPTRDPGGITAMLGAKLYREMVGALLARDVPA